MSNDAHIRAIVRSELRSLLARFAASLPPPPAPSPVPPSGLVDALGAWAALGGELAGLTAAEGIAAGRERVEPWRSFCESAGALVGGARGRILVAHAGGGRAPSAKQVGEVLRTLRGRAAAGMRLVGTLTRNGCVRWYVERYSRPAALILTPPPFDP